VLSVVRDFGTTAYQLVDLGAAIAGIVALRTAHVVFIELLVGIVDTVERRGGGWPPNSENSGEAPSRPDPS